MADTTPLRSEEQGDDDNNRRSSRSGSRLLSAAELALPDPNVSLPNRAKPSLRQRIREANYGRCLCGPKNAACWPPLVCVCPRTVIPMRGYTWRTWLGLVVIALLCGSTAFFVAASFKGWLYPGAASKAAGGNNRPPGANFSYPLPTSWSRLKSTLDASADPAVSPCDDFYQHVCGSYLNATDSSSRIASLQAQATAVIRQIATEQWPLLGDWFDACMLPLQKRDSSAIIELYYVINEVNNNFALAVALGRLHELGIGALWSWHIQPDLYNASRTVAYVGAADGLLSPELTLSNDTEALLLQASLRKYMDSVFALLAGSGYTTAGAWNWSTIVARASVALSQAAPGMGQQYVGLDDPLNELLYLGPDDFDWYTYWRACRWPCCPAWTLCAAGLCLTTPKDGPTCEPICCGVCSVTFRPTWIRTLSTPLGPTTASWPDAMPASPSRSWATV
jgi:hypothetical protein